MHNCSLHHLPSPHLSLSPLLTILLPLPSPSLLPPPPLLPSLPPLSHPSPPASSPDRVGDILESMNGMNLSNGDHREAVRAVKETKEVLGIVSEGAHNINEVI